MPFRRAAETRPQISEVTPYAAIPGGEFQIRGKGLAHADKPSVRFGDAPAPVVIGSDSLLIVRVPEGATAGELIIGADHQASSPYICGIGVQIAEGLHPVSNPVVDQRGNIYTTFSGSPGQKAPVSIYKVEAGGTLMPFVSDLMNPTGLALDAEDTLYVSSRHEGTVYAGRIRPGTFRFTSKVWASRRGSSSIVKGTYTLATAAARSSRSAGSGRFTCSRRWSRRLPRIIWRSVPTDICTSPDQRHRASIRCIAFRPTDTWIRFIAVWGVRRAWRSICKATFMWRRRSAAAAASYALLPTESRNLFLSGPSIASEAGIHPVEDDHGSGDGSILLFRVQTGITGRPTLL